ncbi:MAG: hypothetical protein ACRCUY_01655 [Thermoguttaceae bacterium]
MRQHIYRVVTRGPEGDFRIRDYLDESDLLRRHIQVGVDECSADMSLRGRPIFKGLIGPLPDAGGVTRYESPDVFEQLTKEWSEVKSRRRSRKPVPEFVFE